MRIVIGLITVIALAWSVYVGMAYWVLLTGDHWGALLKLPVQMRIMTFISILPILALDAACVIMWKLLGVRQVLQP